MESSSQDSTLTTNNQDQKSNNSSTASKPGSIIGSEGFESIQGNNFDADAPNANRNSSDGIYRGWSHDMGDEEEGEGDGGYDSWSDE